jgi:hypothetical protein
MLGKKQIQQKMQVRVPTKGALAFINSEKNICGTTPHTARLPRYLVPAFAVESVGRILI